jgi:hypothetical protein
LVVSSNGLVEGIILVLLEGENSRSLIEQQQRLCIVSFSEALLLENLFCAPGIVFGGVQIVLVPSVSSL